MYFNFSNQYVSHASGSGQYDLDCPCYHPKTHANIKQSSTGRCIHPNQNRHYEYNLQTQSVMLTNITMNSNINITMNSNINFAINTAVTAMNANHNDPCRHRNPSL